MLPFLIKLRKPNFGFTWVFLAYKIPKQQFCKNMFHPIFRHYDAVTSCKKLEKFNASINYAKTRFESLSVQ